jgi:hypothetical protein
MLAYITHGNISDIEEQIPWLVQYVNSSCHTPSLISVSSLY